MTSEAPRIPLSGNVPGQGLLLVSLALLSLGAVMVYSASAGGSPDVPMAARQEVRHLAYVFIAAIVMALIWRWDYRHLARGRHVGVIATALLILSLFLSTIVLIPGIGSEVNGARRWLRLPIGSYVFSFQPSELLKIALVIFLACWLGHKGEKVRRFAATFLPASALLLLSVGLVVVEDFGTGALIGLIAVAVMAAAGVRWRHLLILLPPAAAGFFFLVVRNPNRWARITAFINPWVEDDARTWQLRQSLIAIGSGGMWGKGLGNGSMKLGFVPEDRTDFIFAIICEELGFVGAALVLALFVLLLVLCWRAATRCGNPVGRLLATGLGFMIGLQAVLHVAVTAGWAPPTGVNLPLVAAGGTSLVLVAAAIGLVVSITAHPGRTAAKERS
jgi:cell division protein FtsW